MNENEHNYWSEWGKNDCAKPICGARLKSVLQPYYIILDAVLNEHKTRNNQPGETLF